MPRAPIKVGIVGCANINPTSRSRRVGGRKHRAEQAFMNSAGWELGVRGTTAGFIAAGLVRRLKGNKCQPLEEECAKGRKSERYRKNQSLR